MYFKELKIGNVQLKNNILLAPMAGITDLPFRILCRKYGAGLATTEMISSKAIFYGDEKTKRLMNTKGEEKPISIQLFGNDIEALKFCTKYVSDYADIIDLNFGCPAPKIVKNGDGSKLLLDLDLSEKIVKSVVESTDKPVTVKFRKGWDDDNIVAIEAAKRFESAGASALIIHGRTRKQFYSGETDLDIIKKVKEAVSVPVIGNGDITDEESALKMFEYTGVDGIMIGRASIGNPWIFREIEYFLKNNKKLEKPNNKEKLDVIKKHIKMEIEEKGEYTGIREMRKQLCYYIKNLPDSSRLREKINKIEKEEEVISLLTEYFNNM